MLAGFLASSSAGDEPDFEALCRKHPGDAVALRAEWDHMHASAGTGDAKRTSSNADPKQVARPTPTLKLEEDRVESTGSASDELVRRLPRSASTLPRYKLEGEVARGGMGAILRVFDEHLRRYLAMKVVLAKGATSSTGATPPIDANQLARFLEEAQVTGQLDHPGIVPVHELGLDADGRVYFTMKLVKGRDLKHVLDLVFEEKEGWSRTRALGVVLKVCEAMAYAHVKGVIHRDLKPANVMVGNFGEVFVMDWGLARVLGSKDTHDIRIQPDFSMSNKSVRTERREDREEAPDSPLITMDGDVMGTPAYMPPEQARGEIEKLSPRSDVYAIGAMLYHLLARQMPYVPRGARLSQRTVLGLVVQGPPAPLSSLQKDVPAELVAICEKAMARDVALRYSDTLELAEDLRAYLEHRVVGAYETGAWAETRKWVQRNKPLAAALAAALVLLASGLAASLHFKARADDRAVDATEQASIAIVNETRATEQERLANQRASELAIATTRAEENERLATQKANDVLSLSAIQELKELTDRADLLWPSLPEQLPAYERWLADAGTLIDGEPADPARGLAAHPGLKDHVAKLEEIRRRAATLKPEQAENDRRSSSDFAEWERTSSMTTWFRRMRGAEVFPSEAEVETALAAEILPADANGLNSLASSLVARDADKSVYGDEVKAVVLARRALKLASPSERPHFRDTLAWALYRCGRLEDARAEVQRAQEELTDRPDRVVLASLQQTEDMIAGWLQQDAPAKRLEFENTLAARLVELEQSVNERATFEFEDAQDRWWHAQLTQLVADLKSFANEEQGGLFSSGTSTAHGWGVKKRAEFARTIREQSIDGSRARQLWSTAIAAIAKNPSYRGLTIIPQLGLLPLGEDSASHLWEFAHLQSGDIAVRGDDGKLVVNGSTGLVFVLLPGGTFQMGAQKTDPNGPNYDLQAGANEGPVQAVTLAPFFLSKYEMTQGQRLRFMGTNPSRYPPGMLFGDKTTTLANPVESVSWWDSTEVMKRLALVLPTEAQWEFGARAGTTSAWWTGDAKEQLAGACNLADAYGNAHGGQIGWPYESWLDDGWTTHAPVGSYRANAFGLHDVIGNVWEWCRDPYTDYGTSTKPEDGERRMAVPRYRVVRGGAFNESPSRSRCAFRDWSAPVTKTNTLGLRPARVLDHTNSAPSAGAR